MAEKSKVSNAFMERKQSDFIVQKISKHFKTLKLYEVTLGLFTNNDNEENAPVSILTIFDLSLIDQFPAFKSDYSEFIKNLSTEKDNFSLLEEQRFSFLIINDTGEHNRFVCMIDLSKNPKIKLASLLNEFFINTENFAAEKYGTFFNDEDVCVIEETMFYKCLEDLYNQYDGIETREEK